VNQELCQSALTPNFVNCLLSTVNLNKDALHVEKIKAVADFIHSLLSPFTFNGFVYAVPHEQKGNQ
jgi:hypothetical protein